ncbi:MAG: hypothetical protein JSS72_12555 [Armatimonadetes bacterium]|nr:hypothetical protein [Armatimonadota bacterium]
MRWVCCLIFAISLFGCGQVPDKAEESNDPNKLIVGTWAPEGDNSGLGVITFTENGEVTSPFADATTPTGHYTLSGDMLTMVVRVDSPVKMHFLFDGKNHVDLTPDFGTKLTMHMRRISAEELAELKTSGKSKTTTGGQPEKPVDQTTECVSNIKMMAVATLMYATDYDGVMPGQNWTTHLTPYVKDPAIFTCPTMHDQGKEGGYAMNQALLGSFTSKIQSPSTTPLYFEVADEGLNRTANPLSFVSPPRHGGKRTVAYADGRSKALLSDQQP